MTQVFWSSAAHAACPGIYSGLSCSGATGPSNCTTSGSAVTCDLRSTDDAAAYGKFISPSAVLGDLRAWGSDGDGENFCCELSAGYTATITIQGTQYADDFSNFTGSPSADLNFVATTVQGREGNDLINGSRMKAIEYLLGEEGDDTIHGGDGDEYIDGGVGDDHLYGDEGEDTIYGSEGNDVCWGGGGEDFIYGGDDDDDLHGGDENDTLYGEDGDDLVCGEFDVDSGFGGDGDDYVFGGPGADTYNRGEGWNDDHCEYDGDVGGCESLTLTSCTRTP